MMHHQYLLLHLQYLHLHFHLQFQFQDKSHKVLLLQCCRKGSYNCKQL
jgi:hypothetical protein